MDEKCKECGDRLYFEMWHYFKKQIYHFKRNGNNKKLASYIIYNMMCSIEQEYKHHRRIDNGTKLI